MTKPWHDTPLHTCGQPITPERIWQGGGGARPTDTDDPSQMHCLGCGEVWTETDPMVIAHAWWSAGAWCVHDGHCGLPDVSVLQGTVIALEAHLSAAKAAMERVRPGLLEAEDGYIHSAIEALAREEAA